MYLVCIEAKTHLDVSAATVLKKNHLVLITVSIKLKDLKRVFGGLLQNLG